MFNLRNFLASAVLVTLLTGCATGGGPYLQKPYYDNFLYAEVDRPVDQVYVAKYGDVLVKGKQLQDKTIRWIEVKEATRVANSNGKTLYMIYPNRRYEVSKIMMTKGGPFFMTCITNCGGAPIYIAFNESGLFHNELLRENTVDHSLISVAAVDIRFDPPPNDSVHTIHTKGDCETCDEFEIKAVGLSAQGYPRLQYNSFPKSDKSRAQNYDFVITKDFHMSILNGLSIILVESLNDGQFRYKLAKK